MNRFGIFFTQGNTVLRLPVNPAQLPEERESENGEYNVLGLGPILVPRIPGLRKVSISSFFPGRQSSFVLTRNEFRPPEFYVRFFQRAMSMGVPIRYTVARYYENGQPFLADDLGFFVLVTGFRTEDRGGETGDIYYELSLTEYRDYSPREVVVEQAPAEAAVQASTEPAREIPAEQLYVGCTAIANGNWYYTSYGEEPHGAGSGRQVKVSRIVDAARPRPIHVTTMTGGALGWMARNDLQAVSGV